ncbi:hypothetical protein PT2222_150295 [Paraburkholderia tropica]
MNRVAGYEKVVGVVSPVAAQQCAVSIER